MSESAREVGGYQSRETPAGKRPHAMPRSSSLLILAAFTASVWANNWGLSFVLAAVLLWRIPLHARRPGPVFLVACSALSTWALWQHRLLPLTVCLAALALAYLDAYEQSRRQTDTPALDAERAQ
jgi:hypothetical protein